MFAQEIRRAAEAAARLELPAVSVALWQAFGAGQITEAEAATLSGLIEARKALPVVTRVAPRRVGSRPRTDASLERRRRWAASGRLPPAIASRFTTAEVAVLAVVAAESVKHGRCALAHGHLAAVAGVSVSSVKRAIRAARDFGMIDVTVRRVSAFRNDTNVVAIVSPEWLAWMRLARQEGGGQIGAGTNTRSSRKASKLLAEPMQKPSGRQDRIRRPETTGTGEGGGSRKAYVLGA